MTIVKIGHDDRQETSGVGLDSRLFRQEIGRVVGIDRSGLRDDGSNVTSTVFEMDSHGPADQFAQIAAGVPRPVAVRLDQLGVDPDSQLLPRPGACRCFPWRPASSRKVAPVWPAPGRSAWLGHRSVVGYEASEHAADAGHRCFTHGWPARAVRSPCRNRPGPLNGSGGRPCPMSSHRESGPRPGLRPIHDSAQRPLERLGR